MATPLGPTSQRSVKLHERQSAVLLYDNTSTVIKLATGESVLIDIVDLDLTHSVAVQDGRVFTGTVRDLRLSRSIRRNTTYVACQVANFRFRLHRFLMGAEIDEIVDHRDGNGLNNIRRNLRIASHRLNAINRRKVTVKTSTFKGVCATPDGKFRAQLCFNDKQKHLGIFRSEVDAALAYDAAAIKQWGDDVATNFPRQSGCLNQSILEASVAETQSSP